MSAPSRSFDKLAKLGLLVVLEIAEGNGATRLNLQR
jgi:hypothetical protein